MAVDLLCVPLEYFSAFFVHGPDFGFYIAMIAGDIVTRRRLASLKRVVFSRWGKALYSRVGFRKLASKLVD